MYHTALTRATHIEAGRVKKRTEITIETDQVLVVSRRRTKTLRAWCGACAEEVIMMTVDEAAFAVSVSSRTVFHWVEDYKLHFTETPKGLLFVCLKSLSSIAFNPERSPGQEGAKHSRERLGNSLKEVRQPFMTDGFEPQYSRAIASPALNRLQIWKNFLLSLLKRW